ncbi:uncharacterized protein LOC128883854 isoform X2 [Hylaeus volcanicus]|nr:uncharacterized protein LOC128883854 isoform X2 [Hylaeus volcanicus]
MPKNDIAKRHLNVWNKLNIEKKFLESFIVDNLSNNNLVEKKPSCDIDWTYWRNEIKLPELVDYLEKIHISQVKAVEDFLKRDVCDTSKLDDAFIHPIKKLNRSLRSFYDALVSDCNQTFKMLHDFISSGLQCLWISNKNLNAGELSADEWLDSDLYWQAYVERHHFLDPSKDKNDFLTETFEDKENIEKKIKEQKKLVDLFHDRSDTPTLYNYVNQIHSFEYYNSFPLKFLEHMIYFLIRTGKDYHFFPEILPTAWVTHLENLRYRYLKRQDLRQRSTMLDILEGSSSLDLVPAFQEKDYNENFIADFGTRERNIWELIVGRLMSDYIFLSFPAKPIQSVYALQCILNSEKTKGSFYSLGDDINALFYLPYGAKFPFQNNENEIKFPSPSLTIQKWIEHIMLTGGLVSSEYLDLKVLYSKLLETRGEIWFCSPEESVAQGFLRRLSREDPQKSVYEGYVKESSQRWKSAKRITIDEVIEKLPQMEVDYKKLNDIFNMAQKLFYSNTDILYQASSLSSHDNIAEYLLDLVKRKNISITLKNELLEKCSISELNEFVKSIESIA